MKKIFLSRTLENASKSCDNSSNPLTRLSPCTSPFLASFYRSCPPTERSNCVLRPFLHRPRLPSSYIHIRSAEEQTQMNAIRERYVGCIRKLGERSWGVLSGPPPQSCAVCTLFSTPHRSPTSVHRLERQHNAHRASPQECCKYSL